MPPGFGDAKIHGRPVPDVISHREGLEKDLIATVQQCGTAIIKVRGLSGSASGATGEPRAKVHQVPGWLTPKPVCPWPADAGGTAK